MKLFQLTKEPNFRKQNNTDYIEIPSAYYLQEQYAKSARCN